MVFDRVIWWQLKNNRAYLRIGDIPTSTNSALLVTVSILGHDKANPCHVSADASFRTQPRSLCIAFPCSFTPFVTAFHTPELDDNGSNQDLTRMSNAPKPLAAPSTPSDVHTPEILTNGDGQGTAQDGTPNVLTPHPALVTPASVHASELLGTDSPQDVAPEEAPTKKSLAPCRPRFPKPSVFDAALIGAASRATTILHAINKGIEDSLPSLTGDRSASLIAIARSTCGF